MREQFQPKGQKLTNLTIKITGSKKVVDRAQILATTDRANSSGPSAMVESIDTFGFEIVTILALAQQAQWIYFPSQTEAFQAPCLK
jgi:hypothetical protein